MSKRTGRINPTNDPTGVIDAKAASAIAKQYYQDIISDDKSRLTLEEVELSDDGEYWYVTIGVYTPTTSPVFLTQGFNEKLEYKMFKIDAHVGKVLSMKMRQYPLANLVQPAG